MALLHCMWDGSAKARSARLVGPASAVTCRWVVHLHEAPNPPLLSWFLLQVAGYGPHACTCGAFPSLQQRRCWWGAGANRGQFSRPLIRSLLNPLFPALLAVVPRLFLG